MDERKLTRTQTAIIVRRPERAPMPRTRNGRFVSHAVITANAAVLVLLLVVIVVLALSLVREMQTKKEVKPLSSTPQVKRNQSEAGRNQSATERSFPGILVRQVNNAWFQDARQLLQENLKLRAISHTAKNVILFIGDGMGISTVTAARIRDGQLKNATGEENLLSWERFPWSALVKTYNLDAQVGDSAATAGAIMSGVLTNQGVVGVDGDVKRGHCSTLHDSNKVDSILTLAEKAGMSTGLVTTTRVTHATPSVLYAHAPDRYWESDADVLLKAKGDVTSCKDVPDIALQLVEYSHGDGIDVVFGGGRREFMKYKERDPEHKRKPGRRRDGRNLIQEWLTRHTNAEYVWNKTAFQQIDVNKVHHVMGLFESSHMNYEADRLQDKAGEPSLEEMTETAIKLLQKKSKGFFLMVEGGRIDHNHHNNNAYRALTDTLALEKAVKKALEMTNQEETLLIVTADHSHVFTIAGNPSRGNPILGLVRYNGRLTMAADGMPYTTLSYANGPAANWRGTRRDLSMYDTEDKDFHQQATVNLRSETHGGEDVGVYADGPGAYLLHGVLEQNYIFHVMDHALCLSESTQQTCDQHVMRAGIGTQDNQTSRKLKKSLQMK